MGSTATQGKIELPSGPTFNLGRLSIGTLDRTVDWNPWTLRNILFHFVVDLCLYHWARRPVGPEQFRARKL